MSLSLDHLFCFICINLVPNAESGVRILTTQAGYPTPPQVGRIICPTFNPPIPFAEDANQTRRDKLVDLIVPRLDDDNNEDIFEVPVQIDLSQTEQALGSYSAKINWNPQALELISVRGGLSSGFEHPVINETERLNGQLKIAHAYLPGGEGKVNILNLRFRQLKAVSDQDFRIEFSEMTSTGSFESLLPRQSEQQGFDPLLDTEDNLAVFPNPASDQLTVLYLLNEEERVQVEVFNSLGQKIQTLQNGLQASGRYSLQWNLRNERNEQVQTGVYFVVLRTGEEVRKKKVLLQHKKR